MYRMTMSFNWDGSLMWVFITIFTCFKFEIDPFSQNIIFNNRYSSNSSNLISFVTPFTNDPQIPPPLPVPIPLHNCRIYISVFVVILCSRIDLNLSGVISNEIHDTVTYLGWSSVRGIACKLWYLDDIVCYCYCNWIKEWMWVICSDI